MPLQNRVDPFGQIHAVPERGMFLGNRGIIHDPETKTLLRKRWALRAWIICVCEFGSRKREPMGRNRPGGKPGWTELFFMDEVTALSAGHRPCFFCQRERARDFAARFGHAFGIAEPRAPQIDRRLHKERWASGGGTGKPLTIGDLAGLPDGAMVAAGKQACALKDGMALPWSFAGYGAPVATESLPTDRILLITPATTVAVLTAGYRPEWHSTAGR
ncbi:hypothetical protein SAMN04488498_109174 [Mesorhizobium albiziae]|uniref:Uncharacterized protein n=1 Tax=Neomesorhizobium albiziae TaxID=335020 RepID=A0A1I4B5J1_9HYPH|nr:hypothetical protein [Mesorhizobium albiziae]GLS34308.1 hypothetical protein GCM10007937_60230 [Mesorhizobium albiziae]SFK63427.1 hypothetical protein SAMN04488498_109174 [Mesorhizobium albiziae]